MAGKADFWADGQWNFYCDLCGAKSKSGTGVKTWDNFYVCRHHKERRNPQDFLCGVVDHQSVPWTRPQGPLIFVPDTVCTVANRNAIAGTAVAGCFIAGRDFSLF